MIFNRKYQESNEISKKIDNRSYLIFQRNLKKNSNVKITNLLNGKTLIAKVKSSKVNYPSFYNSVITERISEDLEINPSEPYVEITLISNNSSFVAKKNKNLGRRKRSCSKSTS